MNKEKEKSKFQKVLDTWATAIPKGMYKPGKPSEEESRPKSIKERIGEEVEDDKIIFSLNKKYHPTKRRR